MAVEKKESRDASASKKLGSGVGFDRIRRITGYLVGTVDRFNNAKKAELADRVKQGLEEKNFCRS